MQIDPKIQHALAHLANAILSLAEAADHSMEALTRLDDDKRQKQVEEARWHITVIADALEIEVPDAPPQEAKDKEAQEEVIASGDIVPALQRIRVLEADVKLMGSRLVEVDPADADLVKRVQADLTKLENEFSELRGRLRPSDEDPSKLVERSPWTVQAQSTTFECPHCDGHLVLEARVRTPR